MGNSESHSSTDTPDSHNSATPAGAAAAAGSAGPEGPPKDVGQGRVGAGSSRKSSTESSAKGVLGVQLCCDWRLGQHACMQLGSMV
jgi:hypothetical protein